MSNPTPETTQVHQVTDVPPTNPVPVTVVKPKRFIKTRNNVRHPIQMLQRNKSAALLLGGVAAGAVSAVLLSSKLSEKNTETVEESDEDVSALAELYSINEANSTDNPA